MARSSSESQNLSRNVGAGVFDLAPRTMNITGKRPLTVLAIVAAVVAALYFVVWPALIQLLFVLAALTGFA